MCTFIPTRLSELILYKRVTKHLIIISGKNLSKKACKSENSQYVSPKHSLIINTNKNKSSLLYRNRTMLSMSFMPSCSPKYYHATTSEALGCTNVVIAILHFNCLDNLLLWCTEIILNDIVCTIVINCTQGKCSSLKVNL